MRFGTLMTIRSLRQMNVSGTLQAGQKILLNQRPRSPMKPYRQTSGISKPSPQTFMQIPIGCKRYRSRCELLIRSVSRNASQNSLSRLRVENGIPVSLNSTQRPPLRGYLPNSKRNSSNSPIDLSTRISSQKEGDGGRQLPPKHNENQKLDRHRHHLGTRGRTPGLNPQGGRGSAE